MDSVDRWEYCQVRYAADGVWMAMPGAAWTGSQDAVVDVLNTLGQQGWELVCGIQVPAASVYVLAVDYTLKRRLT